MLEQITTEDAGGLSLELTTDNTGLLEQARYVVRLPIFEGPLDLLLHLIEKRQMEITTISLVAVTDQYLAYLQQWQEPGAGFPPMANMAAFVSIAARLLFIKSQSLLPAPAKDERGGELENAATMADELIENPCSRLVVIVTFLAVLEVWKQERIAVQQESLFASIRLERGASWVLAPP